MQEFENVNEHMEMPDNEEDTIQEEDIIHAENILKREEKRALMRKKRSIQVMVYKISIVAVIILIVCAGCGLYIWNLPSLRLSRKMSAGYKYTERGDYANAKTSYEDALEIDSGTVEAYRCLAQNNLEQEDSTGAKEILYKGWENTQDESLLHYYCTVVLNEAVAQINEGSCSMQTINKCIQVLQIEAENEDALSLLEICYERLYIGNEEKASCSIFVDGDVKNDSCQYPEYERQLRDMLELYEESKSEKLGKIMVKYAAIDMEYVYLSVPHLSEYHKLLSDIHAVFPDGNIEGLLACLEQAIKTEEDFADIFEEFGQGSFESAKDFIVSNTYVGIRDSFINNDSGYWEGASAVPINREQMAIHRTGEGFKFFWLDYNEYENPQGVITVWGSVQLDDGVQRTTISYEPAAENGAYYPHTEYVISYEYSNVSENDTEPKMNYRFNTTVTTEEGAETEAIGDWGGENEWHTSY